MKDGCDKKKKQLINKPGGKGVRAKEKADGIDNNQA